MNKLAFTQFEFPHSDIHGSIDICSSPWLFAAYHVLLRLLVPRYSPYALSSLTNFWLSSKRLFFFGSIVISINTNLPFSSMQFSMYLVEVRRVELLTSCLQGRRSSQLSYTPKLLNYVLYKILKRN